MPVNMSYPKPRDNMIYKFVKILRADSSTEKCILPRDAVIVDLEVCQTSLASTGAGAFDLGVVGDGDALVDGFSMSNSASAGLVKAGASVGALFGVKLTADQKVISTYTVGSSTAGGEGWVKIGYFVPGPGEDMFG